MCGRSPVPGEKIELRFNGETGEAFYSGLATCGSVWVCPVCAARISGERREELRAALRIAEHARLGYALATFTLQHTPQDSLEDLNQALNEAYRKTKSGRAWQEFVERWGLVGTVTAYEVTRGPAGWHPHKHVLLFFTRSLSEAELAEVREWLAARFGAELDKLGRYASPIHGVDVRSTSAAVDYVTKWGLEGELTGSESKNGHGHTPFQLLALYEQGDKSAGAAFREYAEATKGLAQLRWSKGLKATLAALVAPDLEPESALDLVALVAQYLPEVETPEAELPERETWAVSLEFAWPVVLRARARGRLLEVARSGDLMRVLDFLEGIGADMSGTYGLRELERQRSAVALSALEHSLLYTEALRALECGDYIETA